MSKFIGKALKAIFEDGVGCRSIVEAIGGAIRRRPVVILEIRDVQAGSDQRAVYRWEASFSSYDEAIAFDEAVRAACEHVSREEE
jgi:hypothetical protein